MVKHRTWPTLFDECKRIELSYLWKRYAMWMPQHRKMSLAWTCCGRPAGNIDLIIDTREMYIELDYRFGDEPRHYRVQLVSVPSNLGKGRISYARRRANVAGSFTEWRAGFSIVRHSVGVATIGRPFQSNTDYSITRYSPDRSRSTSNYASAVKPTEANRHDGIRT